MAEMAYSGYSFGSTADFFEPVIDLSRVPMLQVNAGCVLAADDVANMDWMFADADVLALFSGTTILEQQHQQSSGHSLQFPMHLSLASSMDVQGLADLETDIDCEQEVADKSAYWGSNDSLVALAPTSAVPSSFGLAPEEPLPLSAAADALLVPASTPSSADPKKKQKPALVRRSTWAGSDFGDAPMDHEMPASPPVPKISSTPTSGDAKRRKSSSRSKSRAMRSDAENSKTKRFSKAAVSVLKDWLFAHADNPYPTETEKQIFSSRTKLSISQINYWFINARRRLLQK